MAGQAERRGVCVFRKDEVGSGGVVRLVAGETGDGREVLAKSNVGAGDRMTLNRVIEPVSFIEIEVEPGIHFLERNYGSPSKCEGMRIAIDLHETADMACHAHILRRRIKVGGEITGVW
jgi:hypothetical protein